MKIIISRKGFDSQYGGCASPILSDTGEMFSLPIPDVHRKSIAYADIAAGKQTLQSFIQDLAPQRMRERRFAHLDPDLNRSSLPRPEGWKPVFGQSRAAESHLQNRGVGEGDMFLFFGWFREVEIQAGKFRFVRGAPDQHVFFGWLQVEERIRSTDAALRIPWAKDHPHYLRDKFSSKGQKDSIYISTEVLKLDGASTGLPGAGVFPCYHDGLRLTQASMNGRNNGKSRWTLPTWFHPEGRASSLSYHGDPGRWQTDGEHALLKSVGMGQEFVLDCEHYPEAIIWATDLLKLAAAAL